MIGPAESGIFLHSRAAIDFWPSTATVLGGCVLLLPVLVCHAARGRLRVVAAPSGWPGRIACRSSLEPGGLALPQPCSSPFLRRDAEEPGAVAATGTIIGAAMEILIALPRILRVLPQGPPVRSVEVRSVVMS